MDKYSSSSLLIPELKIPPLLGITGASCDICESISSMISLFSFNVLEKR